MLHMSDDCPTPTGSSDMISLARPRTIHKSLYFNNVVIIVTIDCNLIIINIFLKQK